jgi:hypothetical protein
MPSNTLVTRSYLQRKLDESNVANIQAHLDGKAPILNPSFGGTVSGVSKGMVGLGSVSDDLQIRADQLTTGISGVASDALVVSEKGIKAYVDVNDGVNLIINGDCRVQQRSALEVGDSDFVFGIDRWGAFCAGHIVGGAGNGTFQQITTLSFGITGYGMGLNGCNLNSSGVLYVRQRIESRDARTMKNMDGAFSAQVYHDCGGPINFAIIIKKADAEDNFSAVTTIATSAAIVVPPSVPFEISLVGIDMGDCSNGLEVYVEMVCGAVTDKNFYLTDFVLCPGSVSPTYRPKRYRDELDDCLRFYEVHGGVAGTSPNYLGPLQINGELAGYGVNFAVPKRIAPVLTKNGTWTVANCSQPTPVNASVNGYLIYTTANGSGPVQFYPAGSDCTITADAEF